MDHECPLRVTRTCFPSTSRTHVDFHFHPSEFVRILFFDELFVFLESFVISYVIAEMRLCNFAHCDILVQHFFYGLQVGALALSLKRTLCYDVLPLLAIIVILQLTAPARFEVHVASEVTEHPFYGTHVFWVDHLNPPLVVLFSGTGGSFFPPSHVPDYVLELIVHFGPVDTILVGEAPISGPASFFGCRLVTRIRCVILDSHCDIMLSKYYICSTYTNYFFMAYRRKMPLQRRRKRYTRRRAMTRRPMRHMTAGRVKRIIDAELKFKDNVSMALNIPSVTGNLFHLSAIDVGDGASERIGNWVKPVTLHGTVTVQADEVATEPLQQFRVFIVQWHENQDVDAISLVKLVQEVNQPYQAYNIQSKGAFKILWSWVGSVIADTTNAQYVKTRHFYLRPSRKILFDVDDLRKFHIYLVGFSNILAINNPPSMSFNTRLRYTDS